MRMLWIASLLAVGCASSTTAAPPPAGATAPREVSPADLEGRRRTGSAYNPPDAGTKQAMKDAGIKRITASFKLCIDATGAVENVTMVKSSGYVIYDTRLVRAVKQWTYWPVLVHGKPAPACTGVTFIYNTN